MLQRRTSHRKRMQRFLPVHGNTLPCMITARLLFLPFLLLLPAHRPAAAQPVRLFDTLSVHLAYDDSATMHHDILRFREVRRPKLALVLSGGGARGLSQIGVLKVLAKYHIPVDFIASTI